MTDPPHHQIREVFDAVAELPPERRDAALRQRCGDSDALRLAVERLLEHANAADEDFLGGSTSSEISDLAAGTVIDGKYKLLRVLGEGGLGVVWLTEQTAPVRREVAVKFTKLGMDTHQVLGRFETERNALTMMDHPNIARVHDAGATDRGRPYFVMERVHGEPINEFCDNERLTTRQRIELFIEVCGAVQHAHQKGLIHRDLKPANILVAMEQGRPVPKVIDFGIAKATAQGLTEHTVFTRQGQLIGTPEYMSPEQAAMTDVGVDSTSDIYSLGAILYELLTGVLPFDPKDLRSKGLSEVHRILREQEPAKPSTRLSALGESAVAIVRERGADPRTLRRELRGDLDWITMKSMDKQRARRYASASEFAADLQRYLDREPVTAGPPSVRYRAAKFVRRNRAVVTAAAFVSLALVGGMIGTTWGLMEARRQRDAALEARAIAEQARDLAAEREAEATHLRQAEAEQRAAAERQAEHARAAMNFLTETLSLGDPAEAMKPTVSMRDVLDAAAKRVDETLTDQPKAEALVRTTLGRAYYSLGRFGAAEEHLRRAVRLLDEQRAESIEIYRALWPLARILVFTGDVEMRNQGGRVIYKQPGLLAKTDPELGSLCKDLADSGIDGQWRRVDGLSERMLSRAAALPTGHPARLILADALALNAHAMYLHAAASTPASWGPAETLLRRAKRLYESELPALHPQSHFALFELAYVLAMRGEFDESADLLEPLIDRRREIFGQSDPALDRAALTLGRCRLGQGRIAEAEELIVPAARRIAEAYGERSFGHQLALIELARLREAQQRPEDADRFRRKLISVAMDERIESPAGIWLQALGPKQKRLRDTLADIAAALRADQPLEERQSRLNAPIERLGETWREQIPEGHPLRPWLAIRLESLIDRHDGGPLPDASAGRLAAVAVELFQGYEAEHPARCSRVLSYLGRYHHRSKGDLAKDEECQRRAVRLVQQTDEDRPGIKSRLGMAESELGWNLYLQRRFDEAEPHLRRAYRIMTEIYTPGAGNRRSVHGRLMRFYFGVGRADEAADMCADLLRESTPPPRPASADLPPGERAGILNSLRNPKQSPWARNPTNALESWAWNIALVPDRPADEHALALEAAEYSLTQWPNRRSYARTLALLRYRAGDLEGALELINRSMTLGGPWSSEHSIKAMILHRLGRSAEARAELRRAREIVESWDRPLAHSRLAAIFREAEALLEKTPAGAPDSDRPANES